MNNLIFNSIIISLLLMLRFGFGFINPSKSRLFSTRIFVTSPLQAETQTQFIFFGGKGGVGKTSSSSAVAIRLSDQGLNTLIVSTDPAHSLGDALDVNLGSGNIVPITSEQNLWALEIDVDAALDEFKALASDLDVDTLSKNLGVPRSILDSFGLDDLTKIFANPPPGIDEVVALVKVFEYANERLPGSSRPRFDRIVIDTAPTGHTLRLLQLPTFLGSLTTKLLKFRSTLTSAISSFKNLFSPDSSKDSSTTTIKALDELEGVQKRLERMQKALKDPKQTQFVVVSIPTALAVAESNRLVDSLRTENIRVSAIVCNQVVAQDAGLRYMDARRRSQRSSIMALEVSKPTSTSICTVPYFDTEITGIYGLRFFASIAHKVVPNSATNPIGSRKLTIFGGKGGVGKTTSAASWAVQLADAGLRTLVVSTDPAHSLGDALCEPLSGSPRLLDSTPGGGELWAMEVDPVGAMAEFQDILNDAMGGDSGGSMGRGSGGGGGIGGMMAGMGMPDIQKELLDMVSGIKDPPPGTDEVVALTRVVSMLEEGYVIPSGARVRFDRVVLDTAPTGHTLRMLSLPVFLQELLKKLRSVRDKVGGLGMSGGDGRDSEGGIPVDRMAKFEEKMGRLETILHSPKDCEFTVVTIPTEVAVAETKRLVQALDVEEILVRRIIVNQVIIDQSAVDSEEETRNKAADAYLNRLRDGQRRALSDLQQTADRLPVPLVKVPYFEMETKTVYGLRAIGQAIYADDHVTIGQ